MGRRHAHPQNHLRESSQPPITLAFVSCVADQHPEDAQPPAPEPPKFNPEHRVPRKQAVRRFLRYRAVRALFTQRAARSASNGRCAGSCAKACEHRGELYGLCRFCSRRRSSSSTARRGKAARVSFDFSTRSMRALVPYGKSFWHFFAVDAFARHRQVVSFPTPPTTPRLAQTWERKMIPTPFRFEAELSDQEFQKIGQLSLRWSHIEHIIGNCLKVMLGLPDDQAVVMVFPLSLSQRLDRMSELADLKPLNPEAKAAFDELKPIMKGIQLVRNNVIHAIVGEDEDGGQVFHLRSKQRSLTKAQVFGAEELTNYAAHLVVTLRYALGVKNDPDRRHAKPDARPEIPAFLRSTIQFPK